MCFTILILTVAAFVGLVAAQTLSEPPKVEKKVEIKDEEFLTWPHQTFPEN